MNGEEDNIEEFPEEEDFEDSGDDEYEDEDDAEELFRQNPLKAIFIRLGEIKELLEDD